MDLGLEEKPMPKRSRPPAVSTRILKCLALGLTPPTLLFQVQRRWNLGLKQRYSTALNFRRKWTYQALALILWEKRQVSTLSLQFLIWEPQLWGNLNEEGSATLWVIYQPLRQAQVIMKLMKVSLMEVPISSQLLRKEETLNLGSNSLTIQWDIRNTSQGQAHMRLPLTLARLKS